MALLGGLLSGVRAGAHRSPLAGGAFDAPESVTVTSPAFTDGGAMPRSGAGKGVGDNISPPLRWDGQPPETQQLVLVIDDIDVPLPRPLLHTVAVIEPGSTVSLPEPFSRGLRGCVSPSRFGPPRLCRTTPDPRPRRASLPVPRVRDRFAHRRQRDHQQGAAERDGRARAGPWRADRDLRALAASLLLRHLAFDLVEPNARGHVRRGAPIAAR